jgi:hypothetical protein
VLQGAAIQLLKRQIKIEKSSFGHALVLDKDADGVSVHAEGRVSLSPPSLPAPPPLPSSRNFSPLKPYALHLPLNPIPYTPNPKPLTQVWVYAFNP